MTLDNSEEIAAYIARAESSLAVAKELYASGHYDVSASRAYYAAFYAATAALLREGLTASKHSAVIALVGQKLVKPGKIPQESSKLIRWLFELRSTADYNVKKMITAEDAGKAIQIAGSLLQILTDLVRW